jgi:hypothetical protein
MTLPAKLIQAERALGSRFHRGLVKLAGQLVLALVDMLRFTCMDNPLPALRNFEGLSAGANTWIKSQGSAHFQCYGRVQWFRDKTSDMKLCVEHEPRHAWLAEHAVTFYADDRSGLVREKVLSILAELPPTKLRKVEIAIDFAMVTPVDRAYVRRNGLFGKMKRDLKSANQEGDWWGTRQGRKRVVSYLKDTVAAHRVEFKLRGRFLKQHGIRNVLDFHKFALILPRHHILFARLEHQKLKARLNATGIATSEITKILGEVQRRGHDLSVSLDYLRQVVGLKNVRRLLVPLKTNALVLKAFKKFAADWR